ncbi:phosphatidylinositol 3,4,5-trisphosphate 3-phosphatase and protein-tyrosine-phosphatase PTEN2A isoform X2 [Cynara cardunculus var. scolymus]|uniref:phosphatidylinositol 3,4,5-trisphosphate 3-phosphatase and protein-tyrosine-phosphatase PTEN2A isoform X2 n=1 Tax=Cynara cardunculus var. scolymus TaxID=59895 RepID=UPI000D62840B|nr:phosphatidylinositol 3,4,5-trisphosphate 3-phosphatase and protein-tyrosine-phosphatase PTEN2A isoform X2 [Cynara cardunculus var. scolymus]XP_024959469.1 phosphatidylinositol 3,4,5-trisphosphate 3-phosphatase and protein-tyrosine-phosphatase PTEN2A isoform X2 [Cynara cardunculus var. scolymus]
MDLETGKASSPVKDSDVQARAAVDTGHDPAQDSPSRLSASGITTWAKSLKLPQPLGGTQDESSSENTGKSSFARLTSGLGLRLSPKAPQQDDSPDGTPTTPQAGIFGTITKGFVDTSKNAVKAVQVKARHVVSQNKRRYQEGGFDLDMTYITENIIAMGFPAGDMSSGFFGYVEGFYRNHMEEVIRFFETYHKDKYKVYNLCSERLYDASLFEGKVASFPFDDHNCPPIRLIISFCQSAYSWLKEDIENVVVVHCKAGMARTGLMISSLLLYLKFFPTAEESISYYNQKRCVDGKGLVLPSQIRYVKYFERVMTYFNGEDQPGRRCMLRGFRLHRCPYWIRPSITVSDHNGVLFSTKKHPRTKDLSPEDFWFSAPRKGIMVFALPGEPGLTELSGDFKIHFHDRQGDFYCWLNTTMIENRKVLTTNDLDGFDKRKLPSPGFQVEVVVVDYDNAAQAKPETESTAKPAEGTSANPPPTTPSEATSTNLPKDSRNSEKDDEVFSDTESEAKTDTASETNSVSGKMVSLSNDTKNLSIGNSGASQTTPASAPKADEAASRNPIGEVSDFKAMAADTSVFTFGDDEDYESD